MPTLKIELDEATHWRFKEWCAQNHVKMGKALVGLVTTHCVPVLVTEPKPRKRNQITK